MIVLSIHRRLPLLSNPRLEKGEEEEEEEPRHFLLSHRILSEERRKDTWNSVVE